MMAIGLVVAYALGNFLPALYAGGRTSVSVRTEGSGNPGARNAGRVFGRRAFFTVLLLDAAKGALPVLAAGWLGYGMAARLLVLTAVMLGHCFPAAHRFRGGKGAAAFAGGVLAADPRLAVPILLLFAILCLLLRRPTAAGVLAAAAIIPGCVIFDSGTAGAVSVLPVALLLFTHRGYLPFIRRRERAE